MGDAGFSWQITDAAHNKSEVSMARAPSASKIGSRVRFGMVTYAVRRSRKNLRRRDGARYDAEIDSRNGVILISRDVSPALVEWVIERAMDQAVQFQWDILRAPVPEHEALPDAQRRRHQRGFEEAMWKIMGGAA